MIQVEALCGYARAAVGGGYCYGSKGEVCTPERRAQWAEWNPSQREALLGVCQKWDGRRVWDCSGLFRGAWETLDRYKSGGATTIFRTWCVETSGITHMPDEPGLAVFRQGAPGVMDHIGLYVGGGMVIDARSSKTGVVMDRIDAHAWTHWGRLEGVAYAAHQNPKEGENMADWLHQAVIRTKTGDGVGLWAGTSTNGAKFRHIAEGEVIDVLERLPNGWLRARYDGDAGYVQEAYAIQTVPDPAPANDPGEDDDMIPRAAVAKLYAEVCKGFDALLEARG